MERYEIGAGDRLSELVDAALRGEEAVLVRDGIVIADIAPRASVASDRSTGRIDVQALQALRARLPLPSGDGARLVREMRDEGDW